MTTCTHWQDIGHPQGGKCTLHNRTCSFGVCASCPDSTQIDWTTAFLRKHRLGDKAESLIGKVPGIKRLPCYDEKGKLKPESKCGRRKKEWNGN